MALILTNATFVSMESEDDTFDALVIDGETIAYCGSLATARELFNSAEERDLDGATVLPGFIDAHSHFNIGDQLTEQAQLGDCRSHDDLVATLQQFLAEHPEITPDTALLGANYDHNDLEEGTPPDAKVLDRVSTEIPIFIFHSSGHTAVINTAAIKLFELDENTKDPEGAHYGRYPGTNEPNGYLEELGVIVPILTELMARVSSEPVEKYRLVQELYFSYGITTTQDGASGGPTIKGLLPFFSTPGPKLRCRAVSAASPRRERTHR